MRHSLVHILAVISSVLLLCSCEKIIPGSVKQVMLMWSTDESDPAYADWSKKVKKEFRRQGIRVETHNYYGTIGSVIEVEQKRRLIEFVHRLDSIGKTPDLFLSCGDYMQWQLEINDDSLVNSIPAVCYALKNSDFLDRMKQVLRDRELNRQNLVEIHDTLQLKESLDFNSYLEGFFPIDSYNKVRSYRFVSLLDDHAVWMDSIIFIDLHKQMHNLDTLHYLNLLDGPVPDKILFKKNEQGVKQFAVTSYKNPNKSVNIEYQPVMWQFYRQKSHLRFIQIKHDEVSRSVSEGPNLGPYYTMTAEDFLINDSCIGGHFTSAQVLIRDAVTAGKRMLAGESAESIGRLMHKPARHVNWNLMRQTGANVLQMPDNVILYNTRLSDYSPKLAKMMMAVSIILLSLLLIASTVYSTRFSRRHTKARKQIKSQALKSIHTERVLGLAIRTSGALMWDDSNIENIIRSIRTDDKSMDLLKLFLRRDRDGLYQMQFRGSIDGGEEHWYDIRMNVQNTSVLKRNGFLLNIDKMKETQEKVREAHQMLLDARAREGFISSMNHEIRTPLHAVVGFSTELARPDTDLTDEEIAMYAEIIESNAAQLMKIINDILLVTLMNNANVTARTESCSLKSLLNPERWPEAKKILKYRRNILEIKEGGEDVTVKLDISMASSVIENLLINASNFSNEGSRIFVGWQLMPEGDLRIWVKDEGIGIQKRHYGMIFERFFKVNSFSPGCGLGLSICKSYMDKMGGEISVESNPGQGSVFTLIFKQ